MKNLEIAPWCKAFCKKLGPFAKESEPVLRETANALSKKQV